VSETSELWDKIAEVDYTLHEVSNSQRKLAFEIGESLKELEIPPSAELIELGSGSGKLSSVLAEQGYHTTLMDFSPVALEKAQLFYQEKKLSGQFILGDIFNANSLLNKTYDVTWNSGVMEHFDDKKLVTLFASIYSITKKYYLCIVPNPESLPYLLFRFKAMKTGRWLYGLEFLRDDYEKIAAQAGFKLVKKKYLGLEFTQEYMNYFFGGQGSKDFQQFVENGLVPVKESYLLLYVFQVVEAQEQKTIPVNSVAEAKTIMFDYVSVLLRTNVMNTELFEEQKQRFAHETQLLLAQLDHEKEKNKIIKYILKKVRKTKARILEGNINKLFRLFRQLKEKVLFAMTLYRKYGIFFSLKNLYKECRKAGVYNTFTFVIKKIDSKNLAPNSISDEVFPPPPIVHKITFDEVFQLIKQFNTNHLIQGIICIDTAFDFDDQRNQRTIALAKTFVSLGYFVLFLRYQWNKHDHSEHDFKFFYDRMMQVPRFGMKHLLANNRFTNIQLKKYFFVTIPDEYLGSQYIDIRSNGFSMCYDILDNWEEFHLHGAAPWYKEETELFFVNNADVVSAVSKPLIDKFQHLRQIKLVSNGIFGKADFLPRVQQDGRYQAGYFGHLTDKWFDWDLLFQLAEDKRFVIHLIGEGAPELVLKKIPQYQNILYYGYLPQPALRHIVALFDVGLIPFRINNLSNCVDPLKVYEYLQFGRPVVSTGINHLSEYPYCSNVTDAEQFKEAIIKAVEETQLDYSIINQFLSDHAWSKKCHDLLVTCHQKDYEHDAL